LRKRFLLILDLGLIALASLFALVLRDNFDTTLDKLCGFSPYLGVTLLVAMPTLIICGLDRSIWRLSAMADYLLVVVCVVLVVLGAVALGFTFNRLDGVARSLPVLQGLLMVFAMVGMRVIARLRHGSRCQRVRPEAVTIASCEHVLIIGLNRISELYLRSIAEFAGDQVKIVGLLSTEERHSGRHVQQLPLLGRPEEIAAILRDLEVHGILVDRLVVTTPFALLSPDAQNELLAIERSSAIELDLFAERIRLTANPKGPRVRPAASHASFALPGPVGAPQRSYWRVKRLLDLALALGLIVPLAPVLGILCCLVAIDVGWPVIFWQQRPGRFGRPFRLYKFRTMAAAHDASGVAQPEDRRLSMAGRLLRRTRLDELPQLFNILAGDMSFVGPRPLLPVDQPSAYAARLMAPPGLTGWAQVTGGREISPADKAALDVWYIQNASLALDLKILAATLPTLLFGERVDHKRVRRAWRELRDMGIWTEPKPEVAIDLHK
jgi:lipopolysaccharide/colanic/teichoic acid biosynthesis glycosyltransferase